MDIKVQWFETEELGFLGKIFLYHFTVRATFTNLEKSLLNKYRLYDSFIYSNREQQENNLRSTPKTASKTLILDLKNEGKILVDIANNLRDGLVNVGIRGKILEMTVYELEKGQAYSDKDHRQVRAVFAEIEKNCIALIEDMKLRDSHFDGRVNVTTLTEDTPF